MGCKKVIISHELWGIEDEMFVRSLCVSSCGFIKSKKFSKEFMMRKNKGFTLIEVLIALAITAIVSLIAYTSLSAVMTGAERLRENTDRIYEINRAWMIISRDFRQFVDRPVRIGRIVYELLLRNRKRNIPATRHADRRHSDD